MEVEIRHWREADAEAFSSAVEQSLEHLRPWMPWIAEEPKGPAERRALIRRWERERLGGGDEFFAIWAGGRLAGGCGLHRRIGRGGLAIGYWVHCDLVRKGVATAATRRLLARAFAEPSVDRVEIHHAGSNVASEGVPRRLGFAHVRDEPRTPEAPGEDGTMRIWRLTRAAWRDAEGPAGAGPSR